MFCTGGIRCESHNYVLNSGFERVYHKKGGIQNYLKVTKKNNNKFWDGDCFVFDDRVSVNKNLEKDNIHNVSHVDLH